VKRKKKKKLVKSGKSKTVKVDRLKELLNHFMKNPSDKPNKYKGKICPRLIVVMDDMARYLKHPSVSEFLKNGRHVKAKFFISTQNIHAVLPETLRQVRQWLIFGGLPEEKIKKIREDAGIPLDHANLWKIYEHATQEPYSFMLINKNGCDFEFRRKLRDRYKITKVEKQ